MVCADKSPREQEANKLLTVSRRLMDKFIRRFWSKVRFRSSFDQCWEWTASCDGFGYGQIGFPGGKKKGRGVFLLRSHCASFVLANGPIPVGKHVLHLCDNAPCINPRHLYAGSQLHNAEDRGLARNNRFHSEVVRPHGLLLSVADKAQVFDDEEIDFALAQLSKLTARTRGIIEDRFGLNGAEPKSLEEIGQSLKLSRERVRQLEERGLATMSLACARFGLEDGHAILGWCNREQLNSAREFVARMTALKT